MAATTTFGVDEIRELIATFRAALATHKDAINRLNVYPVPDGDTGTNMGLTLESVLKEMAAAAPDLASTCAAISHGSLMGARGNSGVILSQVLRGLATTFAEAGEVTGPVFAAALASSSTAAYAAVMKPVEGTILTVVREASEAATAAVEAGTTDLVSVLEVALAQGSDALRRTPEMLSVLADAGVVDAGGRGFLLLLNAALTVADGRDLPTPSDDDMAAVTIAGFERPDQHSDDVSDLRYEVMYFLEADDTSVPGFKDVWATVGDSIVVVGGDGIWNCHIHTNDIGAAIEAAIDIGRPREIRVTDLAEEVAEERWVREAAANAAEQPAPPRERVVCAVVAVSPADGIGRVFRSLGVQELVTGGQTMNPSTSDLLDAVNRAPSDMVVILPNNKNIIPVANQVSSHTDKFVVVVPTTSVPEGFASLLAYDPASDAAQNAEGMRDLAGGVRIGEVTQAVRESNSEVGKVLVGDWIGLDRSGIRTVRGDMVEASIRLLDKLVDASHEIVTIIQGVGAGAAETRRITEWLHEHRAGVEAEVHEGGQPHYPYFFGVE